MTVTINDYNFAAFLDYCNFWLVEIELDRNGNSYLFEMPQADHDAYLAAWESEDGQYIPNGKAFCRSLKKLDALQRQAFRNGGHWSDRNYVEGKRRTDAIAQ